MQETVLPQTFEALRHTRILPQVRDSVQTCSQAPQQLHCNKAQVRRGKVRTQECRRVQDTWVRDVVKPLTVRGLCNRCSEGSLSTLLPKFEHALRTSADPCAAVKIIVDSMADSDKYVDVFVTLVKHLMESMEAVLQHVHGIFREFLLTEVCDLGPMPHPNTDYDGFCMFVKEKRRRKNMVDAAVQLGLTNPVMEHVPAAIDHLQTTQDHDVAVHILVLACKHVAELRQLVLEGVQPALGAVDARTKFALLDLIEQREST